MNKKQQTKYYSPFEERINIYSHALGILLSIIGLIMLVMRASDQEGLLPVLSSVVFGLSMILLYSASTIYHSSREPELRNRLRVVDHTSIYLLIAGTYTPFALITLHGNTGWIIFGTAWGIASIGIVLKLFFTGRFNILSTVMYVVMGWIILFAAKPLIQNLPTEGLMWLLAGGVSYTLGAVIYSIKKIKYNHAIFHLFVLMGSFCHFISVYFYVLRTV